MPDIEKTIRVLETMLMTVHTSLSETERDAIRAAAELLKKQKAVVRCKDCIYWQDNNDGYPHVGCKWREDETPDPDDFCSAGELK